MVSKSPAKKSSKTKSKSSGVSRSKSGGQLSRSAVVTVRLDPKLRFGAEIAARKQRRTVSSFIEWAVEEALQREVIFDNGDFSDPNSAAYAMDVLNQIWDVDEPDRFIKLADNYPELLTHDEQVLWKTLNKCHALMKCLKSDDEDIVSQAIQTIRNNWDELLKVSKGELQFEELTEDLLNY